MHTIPWGAVHLFSIDGSNLANTLARGEAAYLSFILKKS
jgi:hypothetical protein